MVTPSSYGIALVVAMRVASVLSIIGSSIIISTFVHFPFFRKPINRLVFFASIGNVLANIATLIGTAVLPKNSLPPSGLCEFQGTLIQWFMMADSFWVLCMATNVFLVFFYAYDAQQLRHLEKWYLAFSYGVPSIPALTYVVLGRTGNQIMGSATLWCWVKTDLSWMRIAFFYAPVWIVISASVAIYTLTGYRILKKRAELRLISQNSQAVNNITVTTQIECDVQPQNNISRCASPEPDDVSVSSSTRILSKADKSESNAKSQAALPSTSVPMRRLEHAEIQHIPHNGGARRNGYRATVTAPEPIDIPTTLSSSRPTTKRTAEGQYFQVAFLMFIAMVVVWLPSSINRMYQFVHKDSSFALNMISAIVLPLQGAWNAIIYLFTSRAQCRRAWGIIVSGKPSARHEYRKERMASSREIRESDVELSPQDLSKQGAHVRHSEMANFDAADDARG